MKSASPSQPPYGEHASTPPELRGVRVLIAEDVAENRELISQLLTDAGALVTATTDGVQAVVECGQRAYDLILMDLQMPGMDGFEATCRIRANGFAGPIVALTAQADEKSRPRWREVGFTQFMIKNEGPQKLLMCLRELAGGSPCPSHLSEESFLDWSGLMGSSDRVFQIIQKFALGLEKQVDDLESVARAGNRNSVLNFTHRLHGTAGNCGFTGLRDAIMGFEDRFTGEQNETECGKELKNIRDVATKSREEWTYLTQLRAEKPNA